MAKDTKAPLVFAHIGDLHITKAKEQNYIDFLSIIAQIETECGDKIDFVFLPGDNADQGRPEQYKWIATALKMLHKPVYIIAGDHDMEQGSLRDLYSLPMVQKLPRSFSLKGVRCIFLDVCGPGKGGPDFHLGADQIVWLEIELLTAKQKNEDVVIFMHTYPSDLVDKTETANLNKLIADYKVVLVDMGHTHYNELANDGQTIFAATRSTGQIEEGPVGYSLITINHGVVSWRFKQLQDAFPFVVITTPTDYRLLRKKEHLSEGLVEVQAVVFGLVETQAVFCQINDGDQIPMILQDDLISWVAHVSVPYKETVHLSVQAFDKTGRPGIHTIQLATPLQNTVERIQNGSDAATIGAWYENGIAGTQLGPNRNAKPPVKNKHDERNNLDYLFFSYCRSYQPAI